MGKSTRSSAGQSTGKLTGKSAKPKSTLKNSEQNSEQNPEQSDNQSKDTSEDTAVDNTDEFMGLYTAKEGEPQVDMTTLDRKVKRNHVLTFFVVTILVLSAVAATLGYVVFGPNQAANSEGQVQLQVETAMSVASGDELEIMIEYTNNTNSAIDTATLEIRYPQGFYLQSSDPQTVENKDNTWELTTIPAGASGTIRLTGQLVGQKDDSKEFTVLLTYTPVNFSSDFQVTEHFSVTVDESIIKLDVNVPEQVRTGEEMQYVYTFTNTASLPLVNVKAFLEYPDGFTPTSADPVATQSNHTWIFDEVAAGETVEVTVTGEMKSDATQDQEFILQIGLQEPTGLFNVQTEVSHTVTVINPEVNLELTATEFARAGDDIEYTVTVTNTSNTTLENIDLILNFSGSGVSASQVELERIKSLNSQESKTRTHKATVLSPLPDNAGSVSATLSVGGAQVGGVDVSFDKTVEAVTQLQGQINVSAEGRYYETDLTKLGSGPIPPQAGTSTEYVIRWTMESLGGDMTDIQVQTTLPDKVSFVSANDRNVSYDSASQTVTYTLDALSADTAQQVDLTISVKPTKKDVGKLLVLINETILTAVDTNSGEVIQAQANQVTSNLTADKGATDDGVVVQ